MPPIKLLSDLIMKSCNTFKRIKLDWSANFNICLINWVEILKFNHNITQLVEIITYNVINLEYLKIPLYSLEQLVEIHRANNPLRKLEIYLDRQINLHSALSLFANSPLKSPKYSIQLSFDCIEDFTIKQLDPILESIFYKSNRIVDFVLHSNNYLCVSIERKELLLRNYPRLKITAANNIYKLFKNSNNVYKSFKNSNNFNDSLEDSNYFNDSFEDLNCFYDSLEDESFEGYDLSSNNFYDSFEYSNNSYDPIEDSKNSYRYDLS
ncbi:17968_t:CDS:2, partial [Racocetra fulgida]